MEYNIIQFLNLLFRSKCEYHLLFSFPQDKSFSIYLQNLSKPPLFHYFYFNTNLVQTPNTMKLDYLQSCPYMTLVSLLYQTTPISDTLHTSKWMLLICELNYVTPRLFQQLFAHSKDPSLCLEYHEKSLTRSDSSFTFHDN